MRYFYTFVALVTCFTVLGCGSDTLSSSSGDQSGILTKPGNGPSGAINIMVGLRGTAVGYNGTVPDIKVPDLDPNDDDDDALCYDVDLVDLKTGKVIGTAIDCLSNITPVGDGVALVGTTTFQFNNGTIVARGLTTVQPTTHGSPGVTHITGAIPSPGDNSILSGTGAYAGASGSVRLSGAVDLSAFNGAAGTPITFDCVFVIDLD